MLIKRKVAVKVRVTEEFKRDLIGRLQAALEQVEQSLMQLESQGRRYLSELEAKDPAKCEAFRRKLSRQVRRQEEVRDKLAEELAAAEKLEIGVEYHQGTVEGLVEVQVGDDLSTVLNSAELLVQDGKIVQIRDG